MDNHLEIKLDILNYLKKNFSKIFFGDSSINFPISNNGNYQNTIKEINFLAIFVEQKLHEISDIHNYQLWTRKVDEFYDNLSHWIDIQKHNIYSLSGHEITIQINKILKLYNLLRYSIKSNSEKSYIIVNFTNFHNQLLSLIKLVNNLIKTQPSIKELSIMGYLDCISQLCKNSCIEPCSFNVRYRINDLKESSISLKLFYNNIVLFQDRINEYFISHDCKEKIEIYKYINKIKNTSLILVKTELYKMSFINLKGIIIKDKKLIASIRNLKMHDDDSSIREEVCSLLSQYIFFLRIELNTLLPSVTMKKIEKLYKNHQQYRNIISFNKKNYLCSMRINTFYLFLVYLTQSMTGKFKKEEFWPLVFEYINKGYFIDHFLTIKICRKKLSKKITADLLKKLLINKKNTLKCSYENLLKKTDPLVQDVSLQNIYRWIKSNFNHFPLKNQLKEKSNSKKLINNIISLICLEKEPEILIDKWYSAYVNEIKNKHSFKMGF